MSERESVIAVAELLMTANMTPNENGFVPVRPDELHALVDALLAARKWESVAAYAFYPDDRVQARLDVRSALGRFNFEAVDA